MPESVDTQGSQVSANPQGLALFNPMDDPEYRQVVRDFADYYCRLKGLPPLPRVEDLQPLQGAETRSTATRTAGRTGSRSMM